jgi:hypothetical protein
MHRQPGQAAVRFQREPFGSLDAFQRAADRKRLAGRGLQRRPGLEIGLRLGRPAQPRGSQAAEIIRPWIAAAGVDRPGQHFVGLAMVMREIGMDAASIHLFEQRILPQGRRAGSQPQQHQARNEQIPGHVNAP